MSEQNQSHLNGHHLANVSDPFHFLFEEAEKDKEANQGYVWTLSFNDTSTINAFGLAKVNYTLHLSASHVGLTPNGVYQGEMSMGVHGDMDGAKLILALAGIGSSSDLDCWFKNDRFVMKARAYDENDEKDFVESFDPTAQKAAENAPQPTGDPIKDAASQAAYNMSMSFINAITSAIGGSQQTACKQENIGKTAIGLWHDYQFRMTEGDMTTFLKLNGGILPIYHVRAEAETDASGKQVTGGASATVILSGTYSDDIQETIENPFPYSIKLFDDNTAVFTLYSATDPKVTVVWNGTIDCIPVEETTVIK